MAACVLLFGAASTRTAAAEVPVVKLVGGVPDRLVDPSKPFILQGPAEAAVAVRAVAVRQGWPIWGIGGIGHRRSCEAVRKALVLGLDSGALEARAGQQTVLSELLKDDSFTSTVPVGMAPAVAGLGVEATGDLLARIRGNRAWVSAPWRKGADADAKDFRISIAAPSFFRPGAQACIIVVVEKTKVGSVAVEGFVGKQMEDGKTTAHEIGMELIQTCRGTGSKPEICDGLADGTNVPDGFAEAIAPLLQRGLVTSGALVRAVSNSLPNVSNGALGGEALARFAAGQGPAPGADSVPATNTAWQVTEDPIAQLIVAALVAHGRLRAPPGSDGVYEPSGRGRVVSLVPIAGSGGTIDGIRVHYDKSIEIGKAKVDHEDIQVAAADLVVPGTGWRFDELLALSMDLTVGIGAERFRLSELGTATTAVGARWAAPWREDGGRRLFKDEPDRRAKEIAAVARAAALVHRVAEARPPAKTSWRDDGFALIQAVWRQGDGLPSFVDGLHQRCSFDGKTLSCGGPGATWTAAMTDFDRHVRTWVSEAPKAALKTSETTLDLSHSVDAGSHPTLTTRSYADDYVVPKLGVAAIFPGKYAPDAVYVTGTLMLQLHFWANPAGEPMWINGAADWRRFFFAESGLRFIATGALGGVGENARIVGIARGVPPVMVGGGIHPLPFVTISGGGSWFGYVPTTEPTAVVVPLFSPYVSVNVELNIPSLVRAAAVDGRAE